MENENYDWDAALAELVEEEQTYKKATGLFVEWAESPYGEFTKMDATGTVAIAVAAYLSGYPNVAAFVKDMDANAVAWLIELMEALIIQGVFIGLGYNAASKGEDMIYMSPEIVKFLTGESYESRFEPPKDYNPNQSDEEDR